MKSEEEITLTQLYVKTGTLSQNYLLTGPLSVKRDLAGEDV